MMKVVFFPGNRARRLVVPTELPFVASIWHARHTTRGADAEASRGHARAE